jgi:hypothetical protein
MWPFPGSIVFHVSSDLALPIAKSRLATKLDAAWKSFAKEGFVGAVVDSTVRLARYRPFSRRALSPRFQGNLIGDGTKTLLAGRFDMSRFEKLAFLMFAASCLVGMARQILLAFSAEIAHHLALAGGFLALLSIGFIAMRMGWRIRQDDIEAMRNFLQDVLTEST